MILKTIIAPEQIFSVDICDKCVYQTIIAREFNKLTFIGFEYPFFERKKFKAFEMWNHDIEKWTKYNFEEALEYLKRYITSSEMLKVISNEKIQVVKKYSIEICYKQGAKYSGKYVEYFETLDECIEYYDNLKVLMRPFLELSNIDGIKEANMTK